MIRILLKVLLPAIRIKFAIRYRMLSSPLWPNMTLIIRSRNRLLIINHYLKMIKNIIIDFKRTIYDPENDCLLENAVDALKIFKGKGFHVRLIGKGQREEMLQIIERLGILPFFNEIDIDNDKEQFFEQVPNPDTWLVIGDRARQEILFGGRLGMKTMWLKKGKFSDELPEANQKLLDYIVSSWREIIEKFDLEITERKRGRPKKGSCEFDSHMS